MPRAVRRTGAPATQERRPPPADGEQTIHGRETPRPTTRRRRRPPPPTSDAHPQLTANGRTADAKPHGPPPADADDPRHPRATSTLQPTANGRCVGGRRPHGHTDTRDSTASRGAGTETASHCITRGNRNAITAPSSNNPALTTNVTCSPCTNASPRPAAARPPPAPELRGDLVRLPQRMPGRRRRRGRHPGHTARHPRRVRRVHHRAQQRDPDPGAQLVRRLADRRRPAGLLLRRLAQHRLVRPEERGLQTEAQQHEPRDQQRAVVGPAHRGQQQHREGRQAEPGTHHPTRPEPPQQPRARQPRRHRREGQRQQPQPGLQRGQPQHQLQVLRRDQFQTHQRQHRQHDAPHRRAERRPPEHREVHQRMRTPPLPPYERDQQARADHQRQHRERVGHRLAAAQPLHAQDHAEQPGRRHQRADDVPGPGAVALGLGQQQPPHREADQHQRDVDEEDRAPPEVLQQEPAEQRPDRRADRGHGAPDADGQRPLPPVGEDLPQDRQRGRHDHRAADAEQRTGQDQHVGVVGEGRERGGDPEEGVAEEQDPSAAHPVAQRAEEDQQRGADERVDIDDPEQFDRAGPEVLGDGGDRHVQHGGVDGDEQQADAEDDQDHPAVGTGPGRPTAQRGGSRGRPGHVRTSKMFPRVRRAAGWGLPAARPERSGVSGPRDGTRVTRQGTRERAPHTWWASHIPHDPCGVRHRVRGPGRPGRPAATSPADNRARDRS